MIRAVLFDMDGTVLDDVGIYRQAWIYAAKQIGFQGDVLDDYRRVTGMSWADTKTYYLNRYGTDFSFDEMHAAFRSFVGKAFSEAPVPRKPGVPQVFEELRRMGIRVALATSSAKDSADFMLSRAGLSGAFDLIVTGECVEHSKPNPDIYLLTAKRLGVNPSECVVAEDSANGVLAGDAAGMFVAMIPDWIPPTEETKRHVWRILDSLETLPEAIAALQTEQKREVTT